MAQSLKARFNGNRQEVLDYAGRYGIGETMTRYNVRDYLAMRRWLIGETGDENYGINPKFTKLSPAGGKNILDQFIEKFADYVVRKDAEIEKKEAKIRLLEAELEYYRGGEVDDVENRLVPVMEACQA